MMVIVLKIVKKIVHRLDKNQRENRNQFIWPANNKYTSTGEDSSLWKIIIVS